MTMQHKSLTLSEVEVKFDTAGGLKFSGYASKFNGIDSYGDTIIKGAYTNTLQNRQRPIQMRWNHYGDVIGKWMRVEEDENGLFVEGELTPGHSKAQDVYASLKHGAISGMSIGYYVKDHEFKDDIRVLKEIELVEISIVETPADLGAQVTDLKSGIAGITTQREAEKVLRDAGFSRTESKAFLSAVKSISEPRDAEQTEEAIAAAIVLKLKSLSRKE
jgi:HK97 family phage prohead protease